MLSHDEFKGRLNEHFARVGKALGSPERIKLLDLLAQGERTVEAIAHEAGLSVANTSRHLQVMREARLVEGRKQGLYVRYRLADPEVFSLLKSLRTLAHRQLAEVDLLVRDYLGHRDELEPIVREKLMSLVRDGSVTVLDVRPRDEFRAGHIPGARSIPVVELKRRLAELPKGREVVAYCRGPYCVYSYDAVAILRGAGRRARRLEEGLPEWREAGFPIEEGEGARIRKGGR